MLWIFRKEDYPYIIRIRFRDCRLSRLPPLREISSPVRSNVIYLLLVTCSRSLYKVPCQADPGSTLRIDPAQVCALPLASAFLLFCFNSESTFLCFKEKSNLAIAREPVYFRNFLSKKYIRQFGSSGAISFLSA